MKKSKNTFSLFLLLGLSFIIVSCGGTKHAVIANPIIPNIDLSHWKVTIPTANENGKPIEFSPPEIKKYASIDALKEFMYPDSTDGSIVFYAYPLSSTANSKYSRSELREQMVAGDNDTNWKFEDGGYMKVTMSVPSITKEKRKTQFDFDKKPKRREGHRVMIAQIHGKLTKAQQKLIGQRDTNAPPILKVYYQDGKIQVKRKILKINNPNEAQTLVTKNWIDDKPHNFNKNVKHKKFTLEVIVSDGRLEVVLNNDERVVYEDDEMKEWNVFENYFKTGNYLNTRDKGASATVKIYELEVSH